MVGMSPGINMETSSGGLLKGMKSLLGGESFFTNKFSGGGEVLLAAALPGDLSVLNIGPGSGWKIAKGAFVGCDDTVNVETKLFRRSIQQSIQVRNQDNTFQKAVVHHERPRGFKVKEASPTL